jgi:methylated-DNA-[protein]-cysteine S-methyltransferase
MKLPASIQSKMASYPVFYQKVWRACARIPRGEVRTYGWIARQLGSPRAARAVGRALAANPFAPQIPCHRVVGANGSLTGYSGKGGLKRKKRLLQREKALPPSALRQARVRTSN